jgi:hypothetical protein
MHTFRIFWSMWQDLLLHLRFLRNIRKFVWKLFWWFLSSIYWALILWIYLLLVLLILNYFDSCQSKSLSFFSHLISMKKIFFVGRNIIIYFQLNFKKKISFYLLMEVIWKLFLYITFHNYNYYFISQNYVLNSHIIILFSFHDF